MNCSTFPQLETRSSLLSFMTPFYLICFALLVACGSAKPTAKGADKTKEIMVRGKKINEEASYGHIVNSVARLRAMMCGVFVQYNTSRDPERKKYSTWMVNDDKDSVVVYTIPVGEANKIGYWMYTYQIMTSLPDEPIYESFAQFTEVNRDTIKCVYYAVPDDFSVTLEELLNSSDKIFEGLDLESLELHPDDKTMAFVKQKPTHYIGASDMEPIEKQEGSSVVFVGNYQDVNPRRVSFGRQGYDKDRKYVGKAPPEHLLKEAMMRSDLPPK